MFFNKSHRMSFFVLLIMSVIIICECEKLNGYSTDFCFKYFLISNTSKL